MTIYESGIEKEEKKFAESLERALHVIKSGVKVGADNLELILDSNDNYNLGPMVDILNRCEIEYKQGKGNKIYSLGKMLDNYNRLPKTESNGLKKLFEKCKEMESLHGTYIDAQGWLTYLNFGRYNEATPPTEEELFVEAVKYFAGLKDDSKMPETIYAAHFGDDPMYWYPPSNTESKYFHPTKEIRDLNDRLENEIHHTGAKKWDKIDVREKHRNDLLKLKEISGDKYAYTRAEILGMLDLYKGYQLPVDSE